MDLRSRLTKPDILVAPGIYDGLTAALVEQSGFSAAYLSGASVAYTRLGRPDIGLTTMTEVEQAIAQLRDRVQLSLIVDGDTGFGNALNTQRTVRAFERAGANAIQLEDQSFPKRCGHLSDKRVVPAAEMVGKIRAACDARHSNDTLIIARTDAVAVEGFEPALERADAYVNAGADILFVEAPRTREQLAATGNALGNSAPLMANMVEGGHTPILPASDLQAMGFSLVIFPGGAVRAIAHAAKRFYETLAEHGTSESFAQMYDFTQLNDLIGTENMIATGRNYEDTGS